MIVKSGIKKSYFRRSIVLAILLPFLTVIGCKKKPTLTDEEEKLVQIMIDLQKVKAVSADSNTFNYKRDSILKKYNTTPEAFTKANEDLSEDYTRVQLVYDAVKDSLKIK